MAGKRREMIENGESCKRHKVFGSKPPVVIDCINGPTRIGNGKNKKIEKDYILGSEIGRGYFGSVRVCRNRISGEEFACKTLSKTDNQEIKIMQYLGGHPGVVNLKAVYEDFKSSHLVMELCSGGSLIDQMINKGRYSEFEAANVIKELMLVIRYCHVMGVVHLDIKPDNILLTKSGKIKLADFGLSKRIPNGHSLCGYTGTPAYVAPEVLVGKYSNKVDIWSAGVILHALLTGHLPFEQDSSEPLFEAIKEEKLDFDTGVWESISVPARDLMKRMLTRDVSRRITAVEVLRHPWIFITLGTVK